MAHRNLYVVGDSISMQYGPYLEQYLRGVFNYARKTGNEAVPQEANPYRDANGGDSSMVLAFLQAMVAAEALLCDVLLVNCGLHDIKTAPQSGEKQVPIAEYKQNLRAIVELIAPHPMQLIWVRTTPCDERVHNVRSSNFYRFAADCNAYNAVADEVMAAANIPAIDLYTFTHALGDDLYCDHVHFHDYIRQLQAAFIAGWLMNTTPKE